MFVTGKRTGFRAGTKVGSLILFSCMLCAVFTAACEGERMSALTLTVSGTAIPLAALNGNARTGQIEGTSGYACFAFPRDTFFDRNTSLEVTVLGGTRAEVCFLFPVDFKTERTLKKELEARPLGGGYVSGEAVTVSMAFPGTGETAPVGFAVYLETQEAGSASVVSAAVVPSRYGWNLSGDIPWFGFSDSGGSIPADYAVFDLPPELTDSGIPWMTVLELCPRGDFSGNERIRLAAGGDTVTIRCAPGQKQAHLSTYLLSGEVSRFRILEGHERVTGITAAAAPDILTPGGTALSPLRADPGLVLSWPQERWRQREFEVFAWEQFPQVLIFDLLDYRTQDLFFKRLAFFTEKKGFTGRLAGDTEIASLHGFNAHDYRAESLAAFFALAEQEKFPLNRYELLLKDILLEAGIIRTTGGGIVPGEGAVISISRESPEYLRSMLLTHEAFHGIYFVDSGFRRRVTEVYDELPEPARQFISAYFSDTPSLNYDTGDTYLMENEFMAYIMQQQISRIPGYFSVTIADRVARYRGREHLAEYVKNNYGADFTEAARKL
ncbi:MAG: hypothetical protein LBR47_06825, partial [Spirochaetaceae bacterium]|nr:hypothetical protein [Spirochaetaceae bacterium]